MAIIKCKMCGGDLVIEEGSNVAECEYCGTRQTVPTADNEKKLSLFARANRLLRGCEFDKASGVFESIVAEFPEEAEAYWGLVLCKYGIEYVDDPATGKKVPTCHRSSFDSVMDDKDFELVMEYADAISRKVYREEAKQIEELRKAIIEVSGKEEPYDIFISYKETNENGDRTLDSVIAQDIYTELVNKGYRVFFSRISLEDKLGTEYEPYIFAALNSAKVMLSVGTDYDYFNAVWVKNEWSRFLSLIAKGEKKVLIPVFKNIDAYDMPKEFARLSAQDMGKVGAMQDLLRGVDKILGGKKEESPAPAPAAPVVQTIVQSGTPGIDALLKRVFVFLEDEDWKSADEYCEKVLDLNVENGLAYLGKLMAELHISDRTKLKEQAQPFDDRNNCKKALRYGDASLKEELEGDNKFIRERSANAEKTVIYNKAVDSMKSANNEWRLEETAKIFAQIPGFKDADELREQCLTEIREIKYAFAVKSMIAAETEGEFKSAARLFAGISGYKDADELAEKCSDADFIRGQSELNRNERVYSHAKNLFENKNKYSEAAAEFKLISGYKDADTLAESCRKEAAYASAMECMRLNFKHAEKYEEALKLLRTIPGWKDADEKIKLCESKIAEIKALEEASRLETERRTAALARLEAEEKRKLKKKIVIFAAFVVLTIIALVAIVFNSNMNTYCSAEELYASGHYEEAIMKFTSLGDFKDSAERATEAKYAQAEEFFTRGQYDAAISKFEEIGSYKDSAERATDVKNTQAEKLYKRGDKAHAAMAFGTLGDYSDARERSFTLWDEIAVRDVIGVGNYHSIVLHVDGTITAVGYNNDGQCDVTNWGNIVAISAGGYHTVGLKSDGTVIASGSNNYGQCDVSDWTDIVAISAKGAHTLGLKSDGTVVARGTDGYGQLKVSDWTNIVAISMGQQHAVGLKANGTVVAVGNNTNGQCKVSGWSNIVAISAGAEHTVALRSNGTVIAAGANDHGQCNVSEWSDIVAIGTGSYHTVGLKADGTVVAVGATNTKQCDVSAWTDIVAIYAGYSITIGIRADGTVVSAGDNTHGQCNVSDWTDIKLPAKRDD